MQEYILPVLGSIITAVASYIGMQIKKAYTKYIDTKTKKEIVDATVKYIEQIYKGVFITNEEKLEKCKEKALEWLNSKNIKISNTELEVLIESAVNGLKSTNKER